MTSFSSVGATLSNPIVTEAAVQYGQGLVNMGQSYLDRNVYIIIYIYKDQYSYNYTNSYYYCLCVGEPFCSWIKEILCC